MDEADELFHLVQGAAHLLLPGQDAVLHLHTFLQPKMDTQPPGPSDPTNQPLCTGVNPTTYAVPPVMGRHYQRST